MLNECATLKAHKRDGFPARICKNCVEQLLSAWKFRVMAIESNIKLHSSYNNCEADQNCDILENIRSTDNTITRIEADIKSEVKNSALQENKIEESLDGRADTMNAIISSPVSIPCSNTPTENYDDCINNKKTEDTSNVANSGIPPTKSVKHKNAKRLTGKEMEKLSVFCKECNRSFGYKYYITNHLRHHKSVFCKECNRSFGYKYYITNHLRHHNGDKPYKCQDCGKCFVRRYQLNLHLRVHTGG
ncbi:Zinc finger, C2H2 type [Popillia japonica]|uniref:Zinc finger, C2H2 type n=1 Tax=Popillia japonica TaxID=7064 RepID=A0AAW1KGP5_POPJA